MRRTLRAVVGAALGCILSWTAIAQKPDRSAPPPVGPPPSFTMPSFERFALSNGLQVVLLEKHQVPLVQVNVVITAGSVLDLPGKVGLASMTSSMMMEGAGGRDALQLADAIDFLGAQLGTSAGMHTSAVTLQTPVARLDSALVLQADVLLRPAFAPAELERKRRNRLTTLLQWRDESRSLSALAFNAVLYGTAHPYGVSSVGDEQAIRSLRVEDLREFHARYVRPANAVVIVVGDVTAAQLVPKLEAAFGSWKGKPAEGPSLPPMRAVGSRSVVIVDKPGAPQTEMRIGRIGAPRVTDDYYALTVLNTILGGSFTSRLNQNLREQHGYTYGAGSSFAFRLLPGPFLIGTAVHTAVTDSALMEVMKELDGIRAPVPAGELERAKNFIALGFPGEFQTVADIAGKLEEMLIYGLPDGYFSDYVSRIREVTAADVQRVARKYLDPASMTIVLVGDRAAIEKQIVQMNLGPVVHKSVDDVLGKPPVVEGGQ